MIGWQGLDVLIAMVVKAGFPVLLVGEKGSGKTDYSMLTGRNLVGKTDEGKVVKFDTPHLRIEDLLGWPIVKPTGTTYVDGKVWDSKFVVFDELNRAAVSVQHKLMEFIRTKSMMNKDTTVEYIMATCNPSGTGRYSVSNMDEAALGRFVFFSIPDSRAFTAAQKMLVAKAGMKAVDPNEPDWSAVFAGTKGAKGSMVPSVTLDDQKIEIATKNILDGINTIDSRQSRMLYRLLKKFDGKVMPQECFVDLCWSVFPRDLGESERVERDDVARLLKPVFLSTGFLPEGKLMDVVTLPDTMARAREFLKIISQDSGCTAVCADWKFTAAPDMGVKDNIRRVLFGEKHVNREASWDYRIVREVVKDQKIVTTGGMAKPGEPWDWTAIIDTSFKGPHEFHADPCTWNFNNEFVRIFDDPSA